MSLKIHKNIPLVGKHNKPIVTDFLYNETKQNQPVVIFCHGYKGFKDWGAWHIMLKTISEQGYFVVAFNFSHNGGTVQEPIDFLTGEALETWKKEGVWMIKNGRTGQMMPHYIQFYEDYQQNKDLLNIKKASKNINVPHLLVHGTSDTSVTMESAEDILSWNPKAEKYFLDTDHVFRCKHPWTEEKMSPDLAKITTKIISFLNEYILSSTDAAIVGNIPLNSKEALAAVGIVGSFLSMLIWILGQTRSVIF